MRPAFLHNAAKDRPKQGHKQATEVATPHKNQHALVADQVRLVNRCGRSEGKADLPDVLKALSLNGLARVEKRQSSRPGL